MEKVLKGEFITSYRDLKVFQRSYKLALELHKASLLFPKMEQYVLGDQIRRSSRSICANIAEGFMRQCGSKAEWKRFLIMSLGSAEETIMWMNFARDLGYVESNQSYIWQQELTEISKMLHKLREKTDA